MGMGEESDEQPIMSGDEPPPRAPSRSRESFVLPANDGDRRASAAAWAAMSSDRNRSSDNLQDGLGESADAFSGDAADPLTRL